MYASSFAFGLGWGDIYIQDVDGGIGKVVEGTDGNLYIYNPISQGYIWFSILPWIKAEPAGDGKYVVKLPQLYIIDVGDPYYAYCMHYDEDLGMPVVEEEGEIEFTWQDGVLTQLGDKFIGLCDATADWFYMADQHIVYAPQTDEITTLPEDMYVQSYTMTYLSDPSDLTKTKETVVSIAIDGEDIYMGHLNDNNPDSFIKGRLADGKAIFPTRQYLGPDAYYNGHIYVLTGDAYVDSETYGSPVFNYNLNDEIVFTVDEDARNIVAEWPAAMITNVGPTTLSILNDYVAPALTAFDEVPAVPANPVFTDEDITINSTAGFTVLHFTIPTVDVDGNKLNENKLVVGAQAVAEDGSKYALPDLPDCSVVVGSKLYLAQRDYDPGSGTKAFIAAYAPNANWTNTTLLWSNQPSYDATYGAVDFTTFTAGTGTFNYTLDITKIAKKWYEQFS